MTPNEIKTKQFDKSMSGFKPDEVTAYLSDVSDYVESLLEEKSDLEQKLMVLADKLEEYREEEDSLRAAIIGAQKFGDTVIRESRIKAEKILSDASKKADATIAQIKNNIARETDALNKMQAEVARFKGQILSTYRQHIELINAIPYDEKDFMAMETASFGPEPQKLSGSNEAKKSEEHDNPQITFDDARAEARDPKEFIVEMEDDLVYEEVPGEMPKKESRHGDLLFGDRYTLTRKD